MQIENGVGSDQAGRHGRSEAIKLEKTSDPNSPKSPQIKSPSPSPVKSEKISQPTTHMRSGDQEKLVGGEVVLKLEPGQPLKLARTSSQKIVARPAPLFTSYADKTEESKSTFQVVPACIYLNKYIGSTEQAMECDCVEEWGKLMSIYRSHDESKDILKYLSR